MNECWIVRIDEGHAAEVARLRGVAGLEVAETADALWLRAPAGGEAMERLLRTVAGPRFRLVQGDQLLPWGKRVPSERLPRLDWLPLAGWAAIAFPVAALSGQLSGRARLRVVRGGAERPPVALLAQFNDWLAYATEAPEIRLRRLAFALSEDRRVFVRGTPLPPLSGQPYAIDGGIAVPCGWSLLPAVGGAAMRELLALEEGDVALFASDGSFERIAADHFVKASRSAVRASSQEAAHA